MGNATAIKSFCHHRGLLLSPVRGSASYAVAKMESLRRPSQRWLTRFSPLTSASGSGPLGLIALQLVVSYIIIACSSGLRLGQLYMNQSIERTAFKPNPTATYYKQPPHLPQTQLVPPPPQTAKKPSFHRLLPSRYPPVTTQSTLVITTELIATTPRDIPEPSPPPSYCPLRPPCQVGLPTPPN